jgi:hypothetical protein
MKKTTIRIAPSTGFCNESLIGAKYERRTATQAVGVISDIGTFLPLLAEEIKKLNK